MAKILVIEDDPQLRLMVEDFLQLEHHLLESAGTGIEARHFLATYGFDIIILDWELPDGSGLDVMREYRARGGRTPILMLTGRMDLSDKEHGLDAGADDYLTKPFNMKELAARLRALLRRVPSDPGTVLRFGDIEMDIPKYLVKRAGRAIDLLPKEFALLEVLLTNPNKVFSTEALVTRIWAQEPDTSGDTVRQTIRRLRQKIDRPEEESVVRTVHGRGYRFESPESE